MSEVVAFPQSRTCPYHPPTAYDPLREERPLSRVTFWDGREVWLVSGHRAARALLADQRLSTDSTRPDFPISVERTAVLRRRRRAALLGWDDPEHNTQRRMLIPSFAVRRIEGMRPRIQATVDRLIDAMEAAGPRAELVSAFALPVPSIVICDLLGVPYEDHDFFEEQSRRLLRGPTGADTENALALLEGYLGELVDGKLRKPGEGVLDDLVARQRQDGTPDRAELIQLATVLLVAGHETTANMISLGVFTLLRHPERLAELRADPALLPVAVEELLRFLSIADGMLRVAREDIEVEGTEGAEGAEGADGVDGAGRVVIRAGEGVVFSTSLINRDTAAYADPDTLDWDRSARHHLAFGYGIHQCLGQNLARAELEIALGTLLRRLPGLRLAAPVDEIPFKPGDTIQGMLELPVTW
ncbi:cytochrome P450 [Streptomyces sp. SKN60]|uniref:cytochrome P450 n=1 Tax=Streptomyces sp. SKN60 TaxID=2855506 RepID=UPI002245E5D6|nr:cytochrome P450 [Streptomyces sp. SKN60]MCX2182791.1 cytochrome P450 [Streptomyces sp. SKN60]